MISDPLVAYAAAVIENRQIQCKFAYECTISGKTSLQNVLSYCRSGLKHREPPEEVIRNPVYFGFNIEPSSQKNTVGLAIEDNKQILLENKICIPVCTKQCEKEQPKLTVTKNLKQCIACPRKGVRYFYKDWTGDHRVCARCHGRYKFSGHRCLNCKYVPEAREVRKAVAKGPKAIVSPDGIVVRGLECIRCSGILVFDEIRGPKKINASPNPIMAI